MQRTVERHIRGLDEDTLTHLDRILLPILQQLVRERPPEAGPVLLALWQSVAQGRVPLDPEVRQRLWHLVSRWNDRVRSQHHPKVSAITHRLGRLVGPPQAPVPPHAGAEDRGRRAQLRGPDGPRHGLKRQREPRLYGGCP